MLLVNINQAVYVWSFFSWPFMLEGICPFTWLFFFGLPLNFHPLFQKPSCVSYFCFFLAQKHPEPLLSGSLLKTLFCPSHSCVPLCLTLLPLCVSRHSAISSWCQIEHPESPVPASVTDLLQRISQHEERIMNSIKDALENPPPSVSSVSDGMEDLEVKPADSGCRGGGCKETDCCRGAEKMELDAPQQQQKPCPGSTDCSSSTSESLNDLLQRCKDVVLELGLPQELISHIEELRNM